MSATLQPPPVIEQEGPDTPASSIPDFEVYILDQVTAKMAELTESNAVDEWHAGILDELVDSIVQRQHAALKQQKVRDRRALAKEIEDARARLSAAEQRLGEAREEASEARGSVSKAESRLLELQTEAEQPAHQQRRAGLWERLATAMARLRGEAFDSQSLRRAVDRQRSIVDDAAAQYELAGEAFRPAPREDFQ